MSRCAPDKFWDARPLLSGQAFAILGFVEERSMVTWQERVVIDPNVLVGKPVIRGTRLAVEFIIDLLAQGWPEDEILRNYPGLVREDIQACLAYVSVILRSEKVYPMVSA
jgi:uncharacterized protein (DUF433 family)